MQQSNIEEQNLDLLCYNFNKELIELINKYGEKIPCTIVFILIKEILNQVEEEKNKIITGLLSQRSPVIEKTVEVPVNTKNKN